MLGCCSAVGRGAKTADSGMAVAHHGTFPESHAAPSLGYGFLSHGDLVISLFLDWVILDGDDSVMGGLCVSVSCMPCLGWVG